MSQDLYAADLVAKFESYFDRSRSRHFDSPIEEGLELSPVEYDEMSKLRDAYMAIVGGLLWLANTVRGVAIEIGASASSSRFLFRRGKSGEPAADFYERFLPKFSSALRAPFTILVLKGCPEIRIQSSRLLTLPEPTKLRLYPRGKHSFISCVRAHSCAERKFCFNKPVERPRHAGVPFFCIFVSVAAHFAFPRGVFEI